MFGAIIKKRSYRLCLLVIGVLSTIIPIVGSYFMAVDVDSAIILTEMERIFEGYMPYRDMHLNYPPLWFYMMVLIKWVFHVPYGFYEFYLTVHYVFCFGCAACIYSLSNQFGVKKQISLFSAWLFMMVIHWVWGNCVLFEIPSLLYGLCASSLVLKKKNDINVHFLYIGVLSCCSFLCKQFGAVFLLLTGYFIVAFCEKKMSKLLYYLIGYSLPLLLCFFIFGYNMFDSILFNGYGTETMELAGWDCSLVGKLKTICNNIYYFATKIVPAVCVSILFIPYFIKENRIKEYLYCLLGIFGFSLQFYFVPQALHYYLYLVPFGVLICALLTTCVFNKKLLCIVVFIVFYTIFVSCYNVYRRRIYRTYYLSYSKKINQDKVAQKLMQCDISGKTIWIAHTELQCYNYLCNFFPANLQEVGYAVGPLEVTQEKALKQLNSSDYVLHSTKRNSFDYYFNDEVEYYLSQFPADTIDENGEVLLRKLK